MANPRLEERLLTAEEFYQLPEPEEGGKLELIDGRVMHEMPVSSEHGAIVMLLGRILGTFVAAHKLGRLMSKTGFLLRRSPDVVLAPDVSFVSRATITERGLPREGWVPYPPDLAIEVVSPSNLDVDVAYKVEQYLNADVTRVWVVRPRTKTVTVHLPDHTARTLLPGNSLTSQDAGFKQPGFELPLDELFAEDF